MDEDKIILDDNNLFWHDSAYRRELFMQGVDITRYARKDGSINTTFFRSLAEVTDLNDLL